MSAEHLVRMANDIGHFFASVSARDQAIAGIANHLQRFWAPRMLRQLQHEIGQGAAAELDPLVRAAVATLPALATPPAPAPLPGGTAPQ